MGRVAILFAIAIQFLFASIVSAQSTEITSGLNYLTSTQNPEGSWGSDSTYIELLPSTVSVIETLQVLNQTGTSNYSNALIWLQLQGLETTDYLSERIHALSVSGTDQDLLISYLDDMTGAWSGDDSPDVDNLDTVLALSALKRINYADQNTIDYAVNYLIGNQNADGGWGLKQGMDSKVYYTALISSILQQFSKTTSIATAINKASVYLINQQKTDGSWGTIYETAYAYLALIGETTDATVLGNAINYLTSTQLANGSWNDDLYSTALALRALANIKPNLSITSADITFSNPTPSVGQTIIISANIKNTGSTQAPSTGSGYIVVQFYDGDPSAGGVLIGETTISSIPSFGSSQASIQWTVPDGAARTIFVKIDPLNSIDELDETDNMASKNLTSSTLADLSITSADIWIFPPCPDPYIMVGIFIKVRNHGETDASNVLVEVYDGNPSSGGVKLPGGGIIGSIPAGGEADTVAVIEPENVREPWKDIYVLIDPQNNIAETNETNNTASKRFTIGASVDLSVSSDGITFNPTNPREGDTVEISARVNNTGYGQPQNVLVRFYLGDPKAGGTHIGTDVTIPSIGLNGNATVSTTWNTTGHIGNNKIYVFADPEDAIEEEYESAARIWGLDVTNNIAFKTLKVNTSQGPDLTLTSSDITFTPQSPLKGDLVTISANIRNIGNQDANNVPVEFSVYDPVIGASLIIGSQTIPFIPVGGSATTQIQWETNIFSGSYDIHVNIDPSNIIIEITETNNEAQKPITITPPQGPDIVIFSIDKSGVSSNPQTRTISGNVIVTIKNIGNQNTIMPFVITAFEDRNNNLAFNPGTDSILGQATYSGNLAAGMAATVNIPVSGTVLFIDSPIYLMADNGNAVVETDETNNIECLAIFTACRNSKVDEAIKEGASWLIAHQLNVDQQGTMKAWAGSPALLYDALALKAYKSTGQIAQTKYTNVLTKLIQMQAPDGSWDEYLSSTSTAILSLLYIGFESNSAPITDAVSWIISQQNTDGGWSEQRGSQSMALNTGMALTALLKAGVDKNAPFIQSAAQWLKNTQNPDGYWGWAPGQLSTYFVDTYPIIGLALATSPTDAKVLAAKNWYSSYRYSYEFTRLYWLKMMLEIEPNNSEIMSVANSLLNAQMPDGGWRVYYDYTYSTFEMTAYSLSVFGKLGFTGTRINNGVLWIENHISSLWGGFSDYKRNDITGLALDALQSANIADAPNLDAIAKGRYALVKSQYTDGSWEWSIPRSAGSFTIPTSEAIFALKYYDSLSTAEQNSVYKGENFLIVIQDIDGGWPSASGIYVSELDKTEYALTALLQAGLTPTHQTVLKGLNYLNARQNPDGGYGNTAQTAKAAIIYKLAGASYQNRLSQTIAWLKANQSPDGGWGTMLGYTSTVGSTSSAIIALSFAGESGKEVAKGIFWLLAAHNEDGGWGSLMGIPTSDDGDTAAAVRALSLARFSLGFNLDISTERQAYCPNDTVRITVTPDKPAGDISLEGSVSLQEGGSYPLTFILTGDGFNAEFTVPENAQPGTATVQVTGTASYGYGVSTTSFIIKNCSALKPDLSISASDIRAGSEDLNNIDSRTVYADVRNQGGIDANNVTINFYKGSVSPENLIDSKTIQNIPVAGYSTVSTVAVLNEDTVIYVVVDPDNTIDESDKSNNMASVILTRTIPDLSISQTDVTIILPNTIEGQPAVITAIIHNIGNLGASDVGISFYDGDPQSGGTLIGSVTKSFIDSGATALADMTWNTFGQSGRNYIHVIVDPQNLIQESNKNNNSTLIPIDVSPPSKPDLAITSSDMTFSTLNPKEGDLLILNATIHNFGTDAGDINVYLYDGNPLSGGILLSQQVIRQIVPFGGTFALSFSLDTIGQTGNHNFYITADPNNLIDETNETNNIAWNSLTIGSSNITVSITTDKSGYTAGEDIQITANIVNLTDSERTGTIEVKVLDLNNNVASILTSNQALTLRPHGTEILNLIWNTGQTLSGNYKVYSDFKEAGNVISKANTQITISPDKNVSSKVTTDKISYNTNEPVTITSTIQSASTNYIFENLSAKITIANNQGTVLYTETNVIPILMPGQLTESKTYWNTSTNPSGDYPVTLEVKDSSGTVLSTSSKILTITDAIKPSKLLRGQISVDKQSLLQGEPVAITYTVTNVGNIDLNQIDLSILTVHVIELTAYDTLTDQTSLQMGATYTNTQSLSTNDYSAKDYLVILRASVSGVEETLSGTYFRVEGAPSAPSLNSPEHGEDIETLTPLLSVNNASDPNDDKLTYEFELYTDSNLTNLLSSSGVIPEGNNITSWHPSTGSGQGPLELQENSIYYWRARAYDGRLYGEWMTPASFRVNLINEPPTAPTPSSPADNSEVDTLTPILIVNNSSDPDSTNLTYNFELALDLNFTQIAASQIGIFEGAGTTSWQVPIDLNENTYYYWRAQADDWLIEGPWMTTARFFVNTANDAPTTPSILYPLNNTEITTLNTDVIASNSEDPDSTTLTYIFEIDTVNTFDSLNIIRSGNIPTTSWHIEGLNDNTYYYVRAKASDGLAESPWSEVIGFFVNTQNDAPTTPVLANPSDGSGVNTFNPTLSVHNSTDIDRDVLTYEFEVYEDLSMTTLVANITGVQETPQITSWTVPVNLTENNTYYWRARVFDGELYSGWMPLASFMVNTANDAPGAPSLHLPANGSSLDTLNPTLSVSNAIDPDSDTLTYDFEIYSNGTLIKSITGIPQDISGITSVILSMPLTDNTTYNWRARAYDGDRYGAWMDMAAFSIHLPVTNITATIDFDPNTLNKKSNGNWVTVYIELPAGYNVNNIIISSIRLQGTIHAELWPYCIGDNDNDGIPDLMVKFKRADVINILPNGDNVQVLVTGTVGTTTFEGVDTIRVIK